MQPNLEVSEEVTMMKLRDRIQMHEAQKSLLVETLKTKDLLNSKIISSLQPSVGRKFLHDSLESRKLDLLSNTRKKLLQLAIEEKDLELQKLNEQFSNMKQSYVERSQNPTSFLQKLEKSSNTLTRRLNEKMNKKVSFHLGRQQKMVFTKPLVQEKKKRKWTAARKKKNRIRYKAKVKIKKQQKLASMIDKIKEGNIVINLSDEEIPAATYVFLAKGLGFVPSCKVDTQDLKYDTSEFIRKLSWKAFFKANPELQSGDAQSMLHNDIKVSGFTYPSFNHPLLDEIKTKLYGWIANHKPSSPKQNLTPLEMRGKRWLLNKIKDQQLFVTKADKGGAVLIMNRNVVQETIENELLDRNKFEKLNLNATNQLSFVKNEVKSLTIYLEEKKVLSNRDKTLIAGLTENNRPKLAPEYQPESPYAYPLFKVHKLTEQELAEKKIPPSRLVHASKFGPLYRMEKWCSPYLTTISRTFCKEEFILDTGDLISNLNMLNEEKTLEKQNVNLFTLDVEKLYPSIDPKLATTAIKETLAQDTSIDKNTRTVLEHFIKLSFQHSYVSYKDETFKSKIGIPTGGSLSRQIADIFLHWILFIKANPKLTDIQAIRFWNRFIDDCIGVWRGTRRSFDNFVTQLNVETMKFGIKFPIKEVQFGKSVHFLDLNVYLDQDNTVQYRGYSKPTDAKRYLNPKSFHPPSVFNSIPFSQLLRTVRNNSKDETRSVEIEQCMTDFKNSGYNQNELIKVEGKSNHPSPHHRFNKRGK